MGRKNFKTLLLIISLSIFSCRAEEDVVFIGDNSIVQISGKFGEMNIKFKPGSMSIDQIEMIDNQSKTKVIHSIGNIGLIKSDVNKSNPQPQNLHYLSFELGPEKSTINDSMEMEITHQLLTNHIIKIKNSLYYLATYEDGEKVYNSLNLKVIDAEIVDPGELKLILKNIFPFKGSLNFYNYDTKTNLEAKEIAKNLYSVLYKGVKLEDSVVLIDVEILPAEGDTLVKSIFTQRINIKQ